MLRYFWCCLLACTWAGAALAQTPPAAGPEGASAAPTHAAPDLVVLKNGSRYRGTIAELTKGESVTMLLITGEKRTFSAVEVAYAGPTAGEPTAESIASKETTGAPAKSVASEGKESAAGPTGSSNAPGKHHVRFTSDKSSTLFLYRSELEAGFRKICVAPCMSELDAREYGIAIRYPGEAVIQLKDVFIDEPQTLHVEQRSRAPLRRAGGIVLAAGVIVMAVASTHLLVADNPTKILAYPALSLGIGGTITGLSLSLVSDKVQLHVKGR